jgi:hypothetical protein
VTADSVVHNLSKVRSPDRGVRNSGVKFGLSLLIAVLLCPSGAHASECIGFFTGNLLQGSQAVFIGEVTSITAKDGLNEVGFRVKRSFKFDLPRRNPFVLAQWPDSGTTDFYHRFQTGNDYLVFVRDNRDGSTRSAPRGFTSRACDAWEVHTAEAKRRISELDVLLRNRHFGRGLSR